MSRIEKVNARIKREVGAMLLSELQDPRLLFVTITAAEVSKDLQHAKVFFSVLGGSAKVEAAQAALDHAKGYVRKLLGQRIEMRYTPEIEFLYDRSVEYSDRIEQTIHEIHEQEQSHPSSGAPHE